MDGTLLFILAAFALDLLLGDPPGWPHPVRAVGWALTQLESLVRGGQEAAPGGGRPEAGEEAPGAGGRPEAGAGARRGAGPSPAFLRVCGAATLLGLGGAAAGAAFLLARIPFLGWLFALYLSFAGLALGQLVREARAVARCIEAGRLPEARQAPARLVSRDTSALDEAGLWRTLAETAAENFCDAFVAPFLFLFLGGPALLWFYKTVSTMDSMWGYKTERFRDLGWAGARGDDVLAWVPARLSAGLLIACGAAMGLDARGAIAHVRRDAARMASPNAGWPMAAAAWLCGASMGGEAVYFGKTVNKPLLGPAGRGWDAGVVRRLITLLIVSGFVMLAIFAGLSL